MKEDLIRKSFSDAQEMLERFVSDENNIKKIGEAGELLIHTFKGEGKVFSCGNGGSLCDAMHFAEELTGRFRGERPALPAIAISDSSHLTCTANDMGFDAVFSRYIEALGKPGDVLLAISTSGNSGNILGAVKTAYEKQMKVIGLIGKDGGKMVDLCDVAIVVPWKGYSDRIQEIHIKIIHILIDYIEQALFYNIQE